MALIGDESERVLVKCGDKTKLADDEVDEAEDDEEEFEFVDLFMAIVLELALFFAARSRWRLFLNQLLTWVVVKPVIEASSRFSCGVG